MMPYLIVPIQVDALFLTQGTSGIGQDVNFHNLPYYNEKKGTFMNADRPYIAESIVALPFQNDSLYLDAGVHLHWTLPALVTTGKQVNGKTEFPAAPNRWYIRKLKNGKTEEWIVESDYLWDADDNNCPIHALSSVPLDVDLASGKQPYAYAGRKYPLTDWLAAATNENNYWRAQKGYNLDASGWGSLVFDTFYANSRSVFGMHDNDSDSQSGEFTYTVIGWYDREFTTHKKDFICELIAGLKDEKSSGSFTGMPREELEKLYSERFNADILKNGGPDTPNESELLAITGTICYGFIDMQQLNELQPNGENIDLAVANTPAEAISALLINTNTDASSLPDLLKEEERLEAILSFGDLSDLKLDLASRLRDIRHEKGFISQEGLWNWRIELTDDRSKAPLDAENEDEEVPVTPLSASLLLLFKDLKDAENRYCLKKNQYSSALDELYMDWSRYMLAMYPPEGQTHEYPDADAIRFAIQRNSLQKAKTLKAELGIYPDLNNPALPAKNDGIGNEIGVLLVELNAALSATNKTLQARYPEKEYVLKREASTRFWEALPPTLVLAAPANDASANELLKYSSRLTSPDNKATFIWLGDDQVINEQKLQKGSGFSLEKLIATLKKISIGNIPFGISASKVNTWHTFRVEWQVELLPPATGNEATKSNSNFDPTFITQNYTLPEEDVDLVIHPALPALSLLSNGAVYSGSSFVTNTIKRGYRDKISAFQEQNKETLSKRAADAKYVNSYLSGIDSLELLGLTLAGFNSSLIQQKNILRLAPDDPFGFKTHRNFVDNVSELLSGGEGSSPDPMATFNPIRCGAIRIIAIRLIDTFGRKCNIAPKQIITPTPNRVPQKPSWVNLPPRLSQAGTMSLRWKDSITTFTDQLTSAPASQTSPVSGWMLPVYMNQQIEFFDALGKHLGAITHKGQWENSVFDHNIATQTDLSYIPNSILRNVIEWLVKRTQSRSFRETFISIFQDTANSILPESRGNPSLFEIIAGTPIAITQLALNLFLKGKPAFDLDWNVYRTELKNNTVRNSKAFTQIRFPFILGDFHKYNDGVIAYWDNQPGELNGPIYFNNAIAALLNTSKLTEGLPMGLEDERIHRYDGSKTLRELLNDLQKNKMLKKHEFTRHYIKNGSRYWDILVNAEWIKVTNRQQPDILRSFDNANLSCTIDDSERLFTVLVHPKGTVNLSTGILPVKKLQLPEASYKTALRTIELSFLAAPVITPSDELNLTLHQDSRYEWSWLKADKAQKQRITANNPPIFTRILQKPHMQFNRFELAWNELHANQLAAQNMMPAKTAWDQMIEWEFLEPSAVFGGEKFAFYKQDKVADAQQQHGADPDNANLTQKTALISLFSPLLTTTLSGINPFGTKAGAVPPLSIQEGWLSIKSIQKS